MSTTRMHRRYIIGITVAVVLAAVDAGAQTARPRPASPSRGQDEKGWVSVDFGSQNAEPAFASSSTVPINLENATFNTSYPFKNTPALNVGGGVRVWRDLGVGVSVSYTTQTDTAAVSAQVPHPFFFNQLRSLSGDQPGLARQETGLHVQLLWRIHVTPRLDVAVEGGPSFYFVKQDLVTTLNYSDDYPHDGITFVNSATASQSKTGTGYNAGVDVAYMFQRRLGVGGSVRYSRAQVQFDLPTPADDQRNAVRADVGGPQYGAGLRLRF